MMRPEAAAHAALGIETVSDHDLASLTADELLSKLKSSTSGLSESEAKKRAAALGYNELAKKQKRGLLMKFLSYFVNPLVSILLIICVFSYFFGEKISALIVLAMAILSAVLSFLQEYRAGKEAEKLGEMVRVTSTILRNGKAREVPTRELVVGDVVDLYAGDMIPADLRIISCKDLFVNQSSLTGESFPVEKRSDPITPKGTSPTELTNMAFMGSSVVSGTGYGLVVKTGVRTQFGALSKKLSNTWVETSFERGVREFTMLLLRFIIVLVIAIFAINAILKGNIVEAFLFSLAVAVGLAPAMLPMIVTINLSKGARRMAAKQVIVKRLNSIQNFGAMDVLCTDKTGTLTRNTIVLEKHLNVEGREDESVLMQGYLNSYYQTGLKNLLDRAILKHEKIIVAEYRKLDEIPFDFSRKIMSVVIESPGAVKTRGARLIAKGAPKEIFRRCSAVEIGGKIKPMDEKMRQKLHREYIKLSKDGFRVLAVAFRDMEKKPTFDKNDETGLVLKGYLAFLDPPKASAKKTVPMLEKLGIQLKVLTGDNELVTLKVCDEIGLRVPGLVSGDRIENMSDEELRRAVEEANVFVRLSPSHKERIINALRTNGHTVGYLGDGINDAPALKASDVGITVDNAVDIARESADIILLRKSLTVLEDGVVEGRKTFGNIIKYVRMGSSSNLGNMISMTGASLFLPFLPMAPIQILVNNFLYDVSQVAIPTDAVDEEYLTKPRPWNVESIKKFMMIIGPVSSVFDFVTFGVLLFVFHAPQAFFHTGWFIESLCTQTLVIHVIRTGKVPFIESRPSGTLVLTTIGVILFGILLTFLPFGASLGFVPMPLEFFGALALIVGGYVVAVQVVKSWFAKKYGYY